MMPLTGQLQKENFDEFGNPLAWSFNYYNDNGELTWVDGPRYNPEDYVFYDHDGAGRRHDGNSLALGSQE